MLEDSFNRAKQFIMTNGRALERARFQFMFENGAKEDVIEQLKAYQNEDGGFGHAIEPDFWAPTSSPMATWFAGRFLYEIDAESSEPMVQSMLHYLISTCDIETGMWSSVMPENNNYPHAPWWHWDPDAQSKWTFNPSVELASFLIHWSSEDSEAAQIGWNTMQKAVSYLMDKDQMDMHEASNFEQAIKILSSSQSIFNKKIDFDLTIVHEKILGLVEQCIEKDAATWSQGYKALPLDFIDGPDHPLYSKLRALVDQNIQFYINQMNEDGVWDASWEWGSYPEQFEMAKTYWKGILAISRYKVFKSFGCLE